MTDQSAVVFEDDNLFCYLFSRIFIKQGVKVTIYSNPSLYFCSDPCVETCPVNSPCCDFLLTDHLMPDMTGLEFLNRTKQMGCKIPDSRKAIISGNWLDEDLKTAKQLASLVFDKSDSLQLIDCWVEASK